MTRYNPKKIEAKWQKKWLAAKTYEPFFAEATKGAALKKGKPFYNLMMFPYPSAEGLHMGSVRTFTGVDIYGRLKRMQGFDVFEPIGLDGFGIHSENYAFKTGRHPIDQAKLSEKNFYRQLGMIGNGFAWDEKLETYDPDYYKWTQWIFTEMFKKGLAYRKAAEVNWCPSCKTVLADEQVINGHCERCDSVVIKKQLEQWFFKITEYAPRLLENLEKIDWTEKIKIAQRNWIGKSEGAEIEFQILNFKFQIKVFTTRPDTLFGATFLVLGPEHSMLANNELGITNYEEIQKYIENAKKKTSDERLAEGKEKTGIELKDIKAINPANGEVIPVWVADYVLGNVGTGAIMAVPAHDERDFEFAKKFHLSIRKVIKSENSTEAEAWTGFGALMDSERFNGLLSEKAKWEITKFVGGKRTTRYRLRDWLISRQRYWAPPIPMIFCETCAVAQKGERKDMPGWYAVPEKDLPVKLPRIKNFRPLGTGESPLASVKSFYEVKCPKCMSKARRETDVSDTFLDSAWYFLRYPSVKNKKTPWDKTITKKWFPVDMYIGGPEHAVLHLLYVRFLTMVFHDWKIVGFEEPFPVFRAHGLITKDGAKMSKSKGNVVNPDEYIRAYGTDAVRMYLAFLAPFDQSGDFRDEGIRGATRFLERIWKFAQQLTIDKKHLTKSNPGFTRLLHKTIKKIGEDIESLQYNTAISALMILLNAFEENSEVISQEDFEIFLKLLAPFAPHITEELFQQFFESQRAKVKGQRSGGFQSIHLEPWPKYNPKLLVEDTFELVVQVNGKVRGKIQVSKDISPAAAEEKVRVLPEVSKHISGNVKKTIFIPNRLINFVV